MRRQSFLSTVQTRVSLSDETLTSALAISSRVKTQKRDKQLALLSQRIKTQSQDQLGNSKTYLDDSGRSSEVNSNAFKSQESHQLTSKLEALEQLELEEIVEDEEESDGFEERQKNKRRTLLDKVVGDVFGKNKTSLYESKYQRFKQSDHLMFSVPLIGCDHRPQDANYHAQR